MRVRMHTDNALFSLNKNLGLNTEYSTGNSNALLHEIIFARIHSYRRGR